MSVLAQLPALPDISGQRQISPPRSAPSSIARLPTLSESTEVLNATVEHLSSPISFPKERTVNNFGMNVFILWSSV